MSLTIDIPVFSCTANDIAESLSKICNILQKNNLITSTGYANFHKVISDLRSYRNAKKWSFTVDLDSPIEFEVAKGFINQDEAVKILLSAEGLSVDSSKNFPFESMDICLLVQNFSGETVARWHFDFANEKNGSMQSGPLTHLQFGGHIAGGDRSKDYPLKVPRWSHPPMDLALLCEVIVANFFPNQWDSIKENPSWCESISISEKLCYSAYVAKLAHNLNTSNTTFLGEVEAKTWIKKLKY